jgi:hypothetical protein
LLSGLAARAKEAFGNLLVEHPAFADLFSEARFQADIESIMDDLARDDGKSSVIAAETIADRVNAHRRENIRRDMEEDRRKPRSKRKYGY